MKNSFIVFEGADHCGKTTQIELLKSYLKEKNEDSNVIFTREPGGKNLPLCEKIREILLDPKNENEIDPVTEAYLYATSRARHVSEIRKYLTLGKSVVCDRYYYSSLVYQGIVRKIGYDQILMLNKMAIQCTYPDLLFYLRIDMDTYKERRMKQKSLDRLEQENLDFFKRVLDSYDVIIKMEEENFYTKIVTIDGTQSPEKIHQEIMKYL